MAKVANIKGLQVPARAAMTAHDPLPPSLPWHTFALEV